MSEKASTDTIQISCPFCQSNFKRTPERERANPLLFCAYCGSPLRKKERSHRLKPISDTILKEYVPKKSEIKETLGQYHILKTIGKGGMGEVFLAYDTVCGRRLAIKRIRQDLAHHGQIQRRFLREARLTSQLAHPSIIPIYSIHYETGGIYYSMPYVAGKTLKQIMRAEKNQGKNPSKTI